MREISIPGMQPGPITMAGHVPGTDPAVNLAMFADAIQAAGGDASLVLVIRAVLARLERAESIAKAATALVKHLEIEEYDNSDGEIKAWEDERDRLETALAEEVQRNA